MARKETSFKHNILSRRVHEQIYLSQKTCHIKFARVDAALSQHKESKSSGTRSCQQPISPSSALDQRSVTRALETRLASSGKRNAHARASVV